MDKQPKSAQPLIVILGPTASGKSDLSLVVAERFQGEIISGDSMQVYRGMDIGTAKLPPDQRRGVAHHLLDIREPEESFSVAEFRSLAERAIGEIAARGRLPLVVGGTGLYIASLLRPYNFSPDLGDTARLRDELRRRLATEGGASLHRELAEIDPESAGRIHPHDSHRLLRALEVYLSSGRSLTSWQRESPPPHPYQTVLVGLRLDREQLYSRIDKRVDMMMEQGLEQEVRSLLHRGVSRDAQSMQGLGYRQLAAALAGECTVAQAVELIKRDTRRFAKRQMTWFKRYEEINWFDVDHYREEGALARQVCCLIARRLKEE